MAERSVPYLYRGKSLSGGIGSSGGSGGHDNQGMRTLIIVFLAVSAVFLSGGYVLYRWANRNAAPAQDSGQAGNAETAAVPSQSALSEQELAARRADPATAQRCADAAALLRDGKPVEAVEAAHAILAGGLSEDNPLWIDVARTLSEANSQLFFSDIPVPGRKILYSVKSGDALIKIAQRNNTTVAALQRSNRLDPANPNIRIGQTLVVYQGNWSIKVSKSRFRLCLYEAPERLFKVYAVGIGRQGRTPTGQFSVRNKLVEPDWDSPHGRIPYGAPGHELGTRWLGISPIGDTDRNLTGYGIHGTWQPDTIGKPSSNGCIRMANEDVNELYDITPYNTPVIILD
jgi:lipoprotein-anchoring transpeptidase ErfK/SrfK